MNDDQLLDITAKIETTLGADNFALISDSIGELLTGNSLNMKTLADKENEIKELKDRNSKLVTANGALLQKVPMGKEKPVEKSEEKPVEKHISWNEIFDKKGNFIH